MLAQPLLPAAAPQRSAWAGTVQLLWRSARPRSTSEVLSAAAVLVLLVLSKLLNLTLPLVLRLVVNALSAPAGGQPVAATAPLVLLYCGLTICSDGCSQLQSALWGRLSFRITQRVSLRLFEHLHALSLRWHLNRKTGEVLAVMNQGVGAVATLLQVGLGGWRPAAQQDAALEVRHWLVQPCCPARWQPSPSLRRCSSLSSRLPSSQRSACPPSRCASSAARHCTRGTRSP